MSATDLPSVSVVIPTRNRRSFLARALQSAAAQTWAPLEVIVIDDASTDDTAAWLRSLEQRTPLVRLLVNDERLGGARSRNRGIEAASADYVAFLDDDDEWDPRKLELQLRALSKSPSAAATCWATMDYGSRTRPFRVPPNPSLDQLLASNICGSATLCVAKADELRDLGGFDPTLPSGQDWDLWIRLRERGTIEVVPLALARYVVHRGPKITSDPSAVAHGLWAVHRKYRHHMDHGTRRSRIGVLYYTRALLPGSRGRRLRALWRSIRLLGWSSTPYIRSALPRILAPEAVVAAFTRARRGGGRQK